MAALSAEEPLRRPRAAASRGKSENEGNAKQGDMPPRAPLIAGFFFFRFFSCFARKMTLGPTFAAQGPALNACNEPPDKWSRHFSRRGPRGEPLFWSGRSASFREQRERLLLMFKGRGPGGAQSRMKRDLKITLNKCSR